MSCDVFGSGLGLSRREVAVQWTVSTGACTVYGIDLGWSYELMLQLDLACSFHAFVVCTPARSCYTQPGLYQGLQLLY